MKKQQPHLIFCIFVLNAKVKVRKFIREPVRSASRSLKQLTNNRFMTTENAQRLESLRNKLALLKARDPQLTIWGSADDLFFNYPGHHHDFLPVATEAEVSEAELLLGITFPEQYRAFITTVGNGGAGAAWGLYPLVTTFPSDEFLAEYPDFCSSEFPFNSENVPIILDRIKANPDFKVSLDAGGFGGYIKLNTYGHDMSAILVVSGEQYGKVWIMEDEISIVPLLKPVNGEPVIGDFFDWYDEWIAECNATLDAKTS